MRGGGGREDLDDALERHVEAQSRIASRLLAVEQHPGHQLLTSMTPTGTTAQRWEAARAALAAVWGDFEIYRRTVTAASQLPGRRGRRSESARAELHGLLRGPIEIGRTVVERRLTGDVEHVETITLDRLVDRMDASYRLVSDLIDAVAEQHRVLVDRLGPLVGRAQAAVALADELGADPGGPRRVASRLDDIERPCSTDPLSVPARTSAATLSSLEAGLAALEAELAELAGLRDGWDERVAGLRRHLDELDALCVDERRAREDARQRVVGLGRGPADPRRSLRERLGVLSGSPRDWRARFRAEAELRRDVAAARDGVRRAREEVDGMLERRDELRGRFESFRAKAVRLGCAERPEMLAWAADIERHLWNRPADPDAAAPVVASYLESVRQAGR